MAASHDEDSDRLLGRLTKGFGALLEQVQQLAKNNIELEKRLAHARDEVFASSLPFSSFALL